MGNSMSLFDGGDHDLGRVEALLRTEQIGRPLRVFESVTSTNTIAAEWAEEGAPHGALVIADYQTQGRGRLGRTWRAVAGQNLTFSIILRPDCPPDRFGLLIIAASLAVAEAIEEVASPIRSTIKWPNDVLLSGKKCCGMLLESSLAGTLTNSRQAVVLGIGMNVNQADFPLELSDQATSILLEAGRRMDRAHLLAVVCAHLERRLGDVHTSPRNVRRDYMARMPDLGKPVRFRLSVRDGAVQGVALGIDEGGGLVLETDGGPRIFHAGEVTSVGK